MRRSAVSLLPLILMCLLSVESVKAQAPAALQSGKSIERSLASGLSHSFTLNLEPDQFAQLVVDQRGIDVIVRVFSPAGESLGEFDTPNGKEGPENFSLTSVDAGAYRIEVSPLGQLVDPPQGRYEIKVLEVRAATEQELQVAKNQEASKARALGLLSQVADSASQLRVLRTRVKTQLETAELLWPSNEKVATKLLAEAVDEVKAFLADADVGEEYYQNYALGMQLRSEVLNVVAQHDPEMALGFLRSTRQLALPEAQLSQGAMEERLELTLANQIIAKDPKIAVSLAQDSLKKGYSPNVVEIIVRLRAAEPELAAQLAKDLAAKLMTEKLLKRLDAATLAMSLLQTAHAPVVRFPPYPATPAQSKAEIPLLSERDYKDLFEKTLNEALSLAVTPSDEYSPEQAAALNVLSTLKSSMTSEMTTYAPGNVAAVDKKIAELSEPEEDERNGSWEKYQEKISAGSMEAALEEVAHAPEAMKESLGQMVVQKAISTGDYARARQLVKDTVASPGQRRQVLLELEWMEILQEASKGKIEEALRAVPSLRTTRQRAAIISQIVNLIGPGLTRAKALELLEQARSLVGSSARVENQDQMTALLEIARAFSRYDAKRAFEVVEPLLDQFNDMSAAALVLDGFGEEIYQDGELQLAENSGVGKVGTQLVEVLGTLSRVNFDRAKAGADRLARQEVQILAYLTIARRALVPGEPPRQMPDTARPGRIISRL
jgi:TPR repeat protein